MRQLIENFYTGLGYDSNSEMAQQIIMEFEQIRESHGAQLVDIQSDENGNIYTLKLSKPVKFGDIIQTMMNIRNEQIFGDIIKESEFELKFYEEF